jgi:hypothetical protein
MRSFSHKGAPVAGRDDASDGATLATSFKTRPSEIEFSSTFKHLLFGASLIFAFCQQSDNYYLIGIFTTTSI